jgi:hypothetical protein
MRILDSSRWKLFTTPGHVVIDAREATAAVATSREGHRWRNIFVSVGIRNSIICQHDSISVVIVSG